MNNKYENNLNDVERISLLTMITMNLLLFVIVGGTIWSVYMVIKNANMLNQFVSGNFFF